MALNRPEKSPFSSNSVLCSEVGASGSEPADMLDWIIRMFNGRVARALAMYAYVGFVGAARRLYQQYRKPFCGVIYLEEAGAYGLVTPFVLDSMLQDRKRGISWDVLSPSPDDFDPQTLKQMTGLADIQRFYRMTSGATWAGEQLCNASFDAMEEHYSRKRTLTTGHEQVGTVTERKDAKGGDAGHTEGTTFRPVQQTVTDTTYKTPALKAQELATLVSRLETGHCLERTPKGVQEIVDPYTGAVWDQKDLARHMTDELIERIRDRPQYKPPVTWAIPTAPPPPELLPAPPPPVPPSPSPPPSPGTGSRLGGRRRKP